MWDLVLPLAVGILRPDQKEWHVLQMVAREWHRLLTRENSIRLIRVVIWNKVAPLQKLGASLFHLESIHFWPLPGISLHICPRLRHLTLPQAVFAPLHAPELSILTCLVELVLPLITAATMKSIAGLCALKTLEFSSYDKPVVFSNLTNLTELGLGYAAVVHCQQMHFVVRNLTALHLSNCELRTATNALNYFKPVRKLRLGFIRNGNAREAHLFWTVMLSSSLRSLHFHHGRVPVCSPHVRRFSALEALSLQCEVPIIQFPNLFRLILNYNELKSVPTYLSLLELRVRAGYSVDLLSSIWKLVNLQILHLETARPVLLLESDIRKKLPHLRVLGLSEPLLAQLATIPGVDLVAFSL